MRELIDCHVHTELSGHGSGTVAQMVSAGVFAGLSGMVMTEHLPLPDDLDPNRGLSMAHDQLESYAEQVLQMAGRVKDLQVVLGIEADWLPGREEHTQAGLERARRAGVQVVLGSVHFIDGWAFDDPNTVDEWERRDVDELWTRYFELWTAAAKSGLFDVMAHPDLPKKFGYRPSIDPTCMYASAAAAAATGGVAIEVSTAGLRKPVGELYPGPDLLSQFREAGVVATVGSDAHGTPEVGLDIPVAYEALIDAGYDRVGMPLGGGEWRWIEL